jgi:hypothetical protein
MRWRAVLVSITFAFAGLFVAAAVAKPTRLPTFVAGAWSGLRPANIDFSGDAGNIVIRLRWSAWGRISAVGVGSSNILSCIPNCAQGKATSVSTRITLSRPRAGHFTQNR